MKKLILSGIVSALFAVFLSNTAFAEEKYSIFIDYSKTELAEEPFEKNGKIYLPIIPVLEKYQNTAITVTENDAGQQLSFDTSDGSFTLNLKNGAYAYIIDNENYGVSTLYNDPTENRMGVLEYKPILKNGTYYLPADEVVELTDGTVTYDENLKSVNIVSWFYLENINYVGKPFPIVYVCTDLSVAEAEKISLTQGYEKLISYCKDLEDVIRSGSAYNSNFEAAYNKLSYNLVNALQSLTSDSALPNVFNVYFNEDIGEYFIKDNSLTMEESIDNIIPQIIKILKQENNIDPVPVNSKYMAIANYINTYYIISAQQVNVNYSYNDRVFNDQISDALDNAKYLEILSGNIVYLYGDETVSYSRDVINAHYAEFYSIIYSDLYKNDKKDNKMQVAE